MKINNKKNNLWLAAAFVFVLAIYLAANSKNSAQAAPNSTVYLNPASVSRNVGESFNSIAVINPGTNRISAVELHISFNHSLLRIDSITPNASAFPEILAAAQIDNAAGTASIILGSGSSSYVTTTSNIATITFTAIGSGTSNVSLTGTKAAASGEGSTNVITSLTGSTITINAAPVTYGNSDFVILVADWLQTKVSAADVNSDGTVNTRDLGIMMSHWAS